MHCTVAIRGRALFWGNSSAFGAVFGVPFDRPARLLLVSSESALSPFLECNLIHTHGKRNSISQLCFLALRARHQGGRKGWHQAQASCPSNCSLRSDWRLSVGVIREIMVKIPPHLFTNLNGFLARSSRMSELEHSRLVLGGVSSVHSATHHLLVLYALDSSLMMFYSFLRCVSQPRA